MKKVNQTRLAVLLVVLVGVLVAFFALQGSTGDLQGRFRTPDTVVRGAEKSVTKIKGGDKLKTAEDGTQVLKDESDDAPAPEPTGDDDDGGTRGDTKPGGKFPSEPKWPTL